MPISQVEHARRLRLGLCPRCGRGKSPKDRLCFRCTSHIANREAKIKDTAFRKCGGWECTCCGESMTLALQLDHINNDGAEHRRRTKCGTGVKLYRWLLKNDPSGVFSPLCSTCNIAKHLNGGECPHVAERKTLLIKLSSIPLQY